MRNSKIFSGMFLCLITLFSLTAFSFAQENTIAAIDAAKAYAEAKYGQIEFTDAKQYYNLNGDISVYVFEFQGKEQKSPITVFVDKNGTDIKDSWLGVPYHKDPILLLKALSAVKAKYDIKKTEPVYFYYFSEKEIWVEYDAKVCGQNVVCNIIDQRATVKSMLNEELTRDPAAESNENAKQDLWPFDDEPEILSFKIIGNISSSKTTETDVHLSIVCWGGPEEYKASEDPDFADAEWTDFSSYEDFDLSPGKGKKTVYLKVRNDNGSSSVKKAKIELVGPTISKFRINESGSTTYKNTVRLYNYCKGDPEEYIASEDPYFEDAVWLDYSKSPEFELSIGAGKKTIYFKIRNDTDESSVKKATIKLLAPEIKYFKINNGASSTYSADVVLNNYCYGDPDEIITSESPYFDDGDWYDYFRDPDFVLSPETGKKTVYMKVRNQNGESKLKKDTITLKD